MRARYAAEKEWSQGRLRFGDATVTWRTSAFKKIKFYTQENIGWSVLDLPAQHLETASCWFTPPQEALALPAKHGLKPIEGMVGIRNVAVNMLPLLAMCDRLDVGGIVNSSNTGSPTIFLYDRYPGGMGFSERGFELFAELMEHCLKTIENCPCEGGCPSCVGLPVTQPAQQMDPDLGHGYPIPDKEAALVLLHHLLGREPYLPRQHRQARKTKHLPAPPPKTEAPEVVSEADQLTRRLRNVRRPRVGL